MLSKWNNLKYEQQKVLVHRIVKYFPFNESILFIDEYLTYGFDYALDNITHRYSKRIANELYLPEVMVVKPYKVRDQYFTSTDSGNPLLVVNDSTNRILHFNSNSDEDIKNAMMRFFYVGYILTRVNIPKNESIFHFQYYYSFHVSELYYPILNS